MVTDWTLVGRFLEQQTSETAQRFTTAGVLKMLCFQGTTSAHGQYLAVSAHDRLRLEPTEDGKCLRIVLQGQLARSPQKGETVTVSLTRLDCYQGFQVRTLVRGASGSDALLVEFASNGELVVHGRHVYTMHNSPNSLTVFEQIPWDKVEEMQTGEQHVLVGVGERANISPRFVFHYELGQDSVTMFHGEGYMNKTYLNLQKNECETRIVVDVDTFHGFCFYGVTQELSNQDNSVGACKVREGFAAGGWGLPQRIYCHTAKRVSALAPA